MSLSENEIEEIILAGAIHDIGRTYIPVEILGKPTRLTEIEFSVVKTHPQVGYDIPIGGIPLANCPNRAPTSREDGCFWIS